jgi:hypothetical protein
MKFYRLIYILISFSCFSLSYAQPMVVEKNRTVELRLESDITYDNPIKDIDLICSFKHSSSYSFSVYGFWDGGNIFKIRFSLPLTGKWEYKIYCSDAKNIKLNGSINEIEVVPYSGTDPFLKKDFVKVSGNGHYLTYGNGEPFFYLAESAWDLCRKATRKQARNYIINRKNKGFNSIQVIPMSHYKLYDYGVMNSDGKTFFLNDDFSRINPEYFRFMDYFVKTANDSGLNVTIMPLHAAMNIMHLDLRFTGKKITNEQSLLIAKYVGARYAGSNIIWIIAGDKEYDTPWKQKFWSEFAEVIRNATGGRQIMTVHPAGLSSSFNFFDNKTTWLGFHTFQSWHAVDVDYNYTAPLKGYSLNPPKPVLGGELCYEDFENSLVEGAQRLSAGDVRQARYESVLSGALAGVVYSVDGVFQWADPNDDDLSIMDYNPRYFYESAWELPGSYNMAILKKIMYSYSWFNFVPDNNLLLDFKSKRNHICVASSKDKIVAYIPRNTNFVLLNTAKLGNLIDITLINPSTGDSVKQDVVLSAEKTRVDIRDTSDYFLVISKNKKSISLASIIPYQIDLHQNYPNPFNNSTMIEYTLSNNSNVSLDIINLLGQVIKTYRYDYQEAGFHSVYVDLQGFPTSNYYYRLNAEGNHIVKRMIYIK